jgi:hypothetical protein
MEIAAKANSAIDPCRSCSPEAGRLRQYLRFNMPFYLSKKQAAAIGALFVGLLAGGTLFFWRDCRRPDLGWQTSALAGGTPRAENR